MPGSDGLRILEFEKNSELRFDAWTRKLIFEARRGKTSSLRQGAARGGVRWKSQHRKKLYLSLLMSKNLKLKKENKSFIPEPISCFSDSYMRMNIMNVLCMWISWSYFWTYITGVMVSSKEMDTVTRVQIFDEADCISHSANTLWEGRNPIILLPAKGK